MVTQVEKYNNARFESYKDFLLKNNANPEIVELKAVQDLIKSIIKNGDPRVIFEGRSPISYEMPNEDGTFDIAGRTNGPTVSVIYHMSYCSKDSDAFIRLRKEKIDSVKYYMDIDTPASEDVIYIDRNGNIVDKGLAKTKKL